MVTRKINASTGLDRRGRINCVRYILTSVFALFLVPFAWGQQDRIVVDNDNGEDITIESGSEDSTAVIDTTADGDDATGIFARSTGRPPTPTDDPFLGIPIPGTPDVSGGVVTVNSYTDITTDGTDAHGIHAVSSTTGYPDNVVEDLEKFRDEVASTVEFELVSVVDDDGNDVEVTGHIDLVGNLLFSVASVSCETEVDAVCEGVTPEELDGVGGVFTIGEDGSLDFDPDDDFVDLPAGQSWSTAVNFTLAGSHDGATRDNITGQLIARVTRNDAGEITWILSTQFDDYGPSLFANTDRTLWPDLEAYAQRLIDETSAGGSGNSVNVNVLGGNITTTGASSHGVLAQSFGITGSRGHNGGGFFSFGTDKPTSGGDGYSGGTVNVRIDGNISTTFETDPENPDPTEASIGVFAYTHGGNGGRGGNGGTYYDGRRGGRGGTGGAINISGNGSINTIGDYASGILALSEGGNGGNGGNGGIFTDGKHGGFGGVAGTVTVDGFWSITTQGNKAHGIWAKSLGGSAGGGGSGGWISGSAGDGGQGAVGGTVNILNHGRVETFGNDAFGIYAQSVGGFGGNGGLGLGVFVASGGDGNSAGSGGDVIVENFATGQLVTHGISSHALFAQSIGGGGGSGGGAGAIIVALGGKGGTGGHAGAVDIINDGEIFTAGDLSRGIFAQSIGGGGGDGGDAGAWAVSIGGPAGGGSTGGSVNIINSGQIITEGQWAHSIFAQSIGGGGGTGGGTFAIIASIAGAGGEGDDGGLAEIDNEGDIWTKGFGARGIHAQSIGGGGGFGGGSFALNFALGGTGGTGGTGGFVDVWNGGNVWTDGDLAQGVFASSIGGGGGNAGSAGSMLISIGRSGGSGGDGGNVLVTNDGTIWTRGHSSAGVFAQSIGGSGGNGGSATVLSPVPQINIGFTLGGKGGSGGDGGEVNVVNNADADIRTEGANSHGVYAQSVGGSGGTGGTATTVSFMVPIEGAKVPSIQASLAIGGNGGGGGEAGLVDIENYGLIETLGFRAYGVYAQSVGGSGGDGGNATSVQLGTGADFSANIAIGGDAGNGGVGGKVDILNEGLIHTLGDYATGVFAQSVGGGGGAGGDATTVSISLTPPPGEEEVDPDPPTPSFSITMAIGGDGGTGGIGGQIGIDNLGTIVTEGDFANGVMAQSVGGSGGIGGDARTIDIEFSMDPDDYSGLPDPMSYGMTMRFGGDGGMGGHGGNVRVDNDGTVETFGAFSHGIVAQSVGGGGGVGGSALTFEWSSTDTPDVPFMPEGPDVPDPTTLEMSLAGSGGGGGAGGNVDVYTSGDVVTHGDFASGIIAQSIGGGGGMAGLYNPMGITGNEFLDSMIGLVVETEAGTSFFGSVGLLIDLKEEDGRDSDSGNIYVQHFGNVQTDGDAAHGLLAQTAASAARSGAVTVDYYGSIYTAGDYSYGLYAQSGGGTGSGDININLFNEFEGEEFNSMIVGGSGEGAGVVIQGGNNNRLYNEGLITSVEDVLGRAIVASYGNDRVENYGTVIGDVDLGAGSNYFVNYGLVNSGSTFYMGAGNQLLNEGNFSIGGIDNVWTTMFEGDFEQTAAGTMWFDIEFDYGADTADWLDIRGGANLDGMLALTLHNPGKIAPGDQEFVLITSSSGFGTTNLELLAPVSAVVDFNLYNPSETQYALSYDVDFAASGLNSNQAAMGEHFNAIQLAGGTDADMQSLVTSIVSQPDVESLAAAYDLLSPHIYSANQVSRMFSSLDFAQAMMSCPVKDGDYRFSREGNCTWMRVSDRDIEYEASSGELGATDYAQTINFGFQRALTNRWHGGIAFGLEDSEYEIPLASKRYGRQAQLGGILKGRYGASQFNISATAGSGNYRIGREMGMPSAEHSYTNRDLLFYSTHLGYNYSLEGERWYLRPGADVGWVGVNGDRFEEVMAGPASLEVQETDDNYMTSRIDLLLGVEFGSLDKVLYRPFLKTSWTHIHADSSNAIQARLQGAPDDVPFFTQILDTEDDFTNVSLGMQMFLKENWTFNVAYEHTNAGDWQAESYYGKVNYAF